MLVVNLHGCMGHLARNSNNRMLDIFSREKKKVRMVTQMFRLLDIFLNAFSSYFSMCFFLKVLLWRLCFRKMLFFLLVLSSVFLEPRISSTVCHFIFFVLDALLSL